jgi:hypothetical protein
MLPSPKLSSGMILLRIAASLMPNERTSRATQLLMKSVIESWTLSKLEATPQKTKAPSSPTSNIMAPSKYLNRTVSIPFYAKIGIAHSLHAN